MYTAYIALIISFILVIVLHAWFVRRLTGLHEQVRECKSEYQKLHAETMELAESVGELDRGKDSNATSIQALEREIEDTKIKIREFLAENQELEGEFGVSGKEEDVETEGEEEEMEEAAASTGDDT
jgi:uncharacterized protein (DUF342 family)